MGQASAKAQGPGLPSSLPHPSFSIRLKVKEADALAANYNIFLIKGSFFFLFYLFMWFVFYVNFSAEGLTTFACNYFDILCY